MDSITIHVLVWTILATVSIRTAFNFPYLTNAALTTNAISRRRRIASTAGVEDLQPQAEVCKEFVESKVVVKGAKAASPADIFNNLSIGKDFATSGRKYPKNYVFQSPNYPHNYPNNLECFKLIVAPSHHRILLRTLQPFSLEPDSLCAMDFLEIRDGAFGFSPLIGRFCSRLPPPENEEIKSSSRYLWLRFRSDNTLPHAGFRMMFHFEKVGSEKDENDDPSPKILRRLNVIQLSEDEQWTMRSEFLTKQLDFISAEERQLPLEAVFDFRSPLDTHILMYVHHFQVPQVAAWSCDPEYLVKQQAIKYCDGHSDPVTRFAEKPASIIQVKRLTPTIPDPVSYMDGIHTFVEIYTEWRTISESSPPCPRISRFCIASPHTDLSDVTGSSSSSSGSSSSSDKSAEEGRAHRQFLVASPRLVVRLVVAKPYRSLTDSTTDNRHVGGMRNGIDSMEKKNPLDIFSILPNFTLTLTTLSPRINGVCAYNQRACDEAYCIQTNHWCDGMINCPQGQDEGNAACNPEKVGVIESVDETDTTGLSEKDMAALERAMEEKADLEKHAAIIGSISLTLIIITVICMFFAIRRKRREASHHEIEIKLPPELDSRHLNSANANDTENLIQPAFQSSKLLFKDVFIDLEDIENEPVFSSSGDALLGRESSTAQKSTLGPSKIFPFHNWDRKTPAEVSKTFGLNAIPKSPSSKAGNLRSPLFKHQRIQHQQKFLRNEWQSDANLIQHTRGKLNTVDSAKMTEEGAIFHCPNPQPPPRMSNPPSSLTSVSVKNRRFQSSHPEEQQPERFKGGLNHSRRQHLHHHHHPSHQKQKQDKDLRQPQQSASFLSQKTRSTDVPDSSCHQSHVLNCRMVTDQQRPRSLATSRFHLYNSRDLMPYRSSLNKGESCSRSSSSHSVSSTCSSGSKISMSFSSSPCSSNSTTTTSFYPQRHVPWRYQGYENLAPYSIHLKTFRSMPDVARVSGSGVGDGGGVGGYQFTLSCNHKDCRDYYRLQALRFGVQMERRRPEKAGAEKPILLRETEIDLTPSSQEENVQNDSSAIGNPGGKSIALLHPIALDAYSAQGLSDGISLASSKNEGSLSEVTQSAFTDESDEHERRSSYTSSNSPISPRPLSRIGSTTLSHIVSLSKRLDSPSSSRSRVRVLPTASNLLVYEYEA